MDAGRCTRMVYRPSSDQFTADAGSLYQPLQNITATTTSSIAATKAALALGGIFHMNLSSLGARLREPRLARTPAGGLAFATDLAHGRIRFAFSAPVG